MQTIQGSLTLSRDFAHPHCSRNSFNSTSQHSHIARTQISLKKFTSVSSSHRYGRPHYYMYMLSSSPCHIFESAYAFAPTPPAWVVVSELTSSYCFMILSSTFSANTSTSVLWNLRALIRLSNRTSICANVRPLGSGRLKYVYTTQQKQIPAWKRICQISWA